MGAVNEAQVRAALDRVVDPIRGESITKLGLVSGLQIKDGNVGFALEIAADQGSVMEPVRKAAEAAVFALPGVSSVTAVLTAQRPATPAGTERPATPAGTERPAAPPGSRRLSLPDIGSIIAVASGKGGVGKSTTAVNLAVALAMQGTRVGILDADIYGPSIPRMLGLAGKPQTADGKLVPLESHGVKAMSIGFLVPEDTPMIWRGPMVMGALEQMLRDVAWGTLDVLVVDMPPGTGDAQLTMAQRVPLAGAVIVSTPQDIALLDARRGLNMFQKVDVPVLGIIENMSYFMCPHCGERTEIFAHGGARAEAASLGTAFLGEIPLDMAIRETSDGGTPIVAAQPNSPHTAAYRAIAADVLSRLRGDAAPARQAPRIIME